MGRTARAGKSGLSVSLIGEADRKLLKLAIKGSKDAVKQRIIHPELLREVRQKMEELTDALAEILEEEAAAKALAEAELQLTKAQNLIEHADEIYSRPKKTFIQKKNAKSRHDKR